MISASSPRSRKYSPHCATGIRCQVLQCSGFRRGCYHNDGVSQCAVLFQFTYHVRNGGRFLADSDIDTFDTGIALVDDGIDSQCGFTCLTATDDQFTLTTTDWDDGVNGFITGLYRLIYGLTFDNAPERLLLQQRSRRDPADLYRRLVHPEC